MDIRNLLRLGRRISQLLGGHLNHLAIAPDIERTPVSYMRFNHLLNSRFQGYFSAFPKWQFENIWRRFRRVSHIAQSKLCMRLALLYGGVAMLSPGVGEAWEGTRGREHDDPQKEHVTVSTIFPASSRFRLHNMTGLYSQMFGVACHGFHPKPKL